MFTASLIVLFLPQNKTVKEKERALPGFFGIHMILELKKGTLPAPENCRPEPSSGSIWLFIRFV